MTNPALPKPSLNDVADVDRIFSTASIASGEEKGVTTQPFSSFMQEGKSAQAAMSGKAAMISPFDLAHGTPLATSAPTLGALVTQVNNAQSTLGDVSTFLNTPNLKLKSSQKYLLKNKMSEANANLRAANAKMGANIPPEPALSNFQGPLGRFLAYLSDGQQQIESAKAHLENLKDKGANLTPGDFLLIQVKMNKAQQQLEYSSVLLANAVNAIKQLSQVQL